MCVDNYIDIHMHIYTTIYIYLPADDTHVHRRDSSAAHIEQYDRNYEAGHRSLRPPDHAAVAPNRSHAPSGVRRLAARSCAVEWVSEWVA